MMDLNNDSLRVICAHVVNGGSVLELCDMWGVSFDKVWMWLQEDKERSNLYDKAVRAQNEWALSLAERFHGRVVHTEYAKVEKKSGAASKRAVIVVYQVRP